MAEKEQSGSKLDAFLERIPILDGGGRRRLTAGTITLMTVGVVSNIWPHVKEAIAARDTSLSLFLAVGALLIYATGVLVELIGEIFLARAVANAVWSYMEAANATRRFRPLLRPLAWVHIAVWGSSRALVYFLQGLFGRSRWRMRFRRELSAGGRRAYDKLPYAVRLALKHSLGAKAEFGRMALIELMATPRKRRWGMMMTERPKDVLALVSAIVISLLILLVWSPIRQDLTQATASNLNAVRTELDKIKNPLDAASEEIEDAVATMTEKLDVHSAESLKSDVASFESDLNSFDSLLESVGILKSLTSVDYLRFARQYTANDAYARIVSACQFKGALSNRTGPQTTVFQKVRTANTSACKALTATGYFPAPIVIAYEELNRSARQQASVRIVSGLAALFLYVAFFNTLTSVTISMIETIGLEDLTEVS
jgi:hypothetical protein